MTDRSGANSDPMQQLADHLDAIDALIHMPDVVAQVGTGFEREISYALSGFRQRFPDRFDPQQPLL